MLCYAVLCCTVLYCVVLDSASEYVTQDPARMIYKLNICGLATTPVRPLFVVFVHV